MNVEWGCSRALCNWFMSALTPAMFSLTACSQNPPAKSNPVAAKTPIMDGMVDVGGLSLHIHCVGEGTPVVVFDSGLGLSGTAWEDVQPEVGRFTRACVYDRAGRG